MLTTVWKQLAMYSRSGWCWWPCVKRSELQVIWGITMEILL